MDYELDEVIHAMKVYHKVELEAEKFLSFAAFAMKHKELKIRSARETLKAIEEYRKLPLELKKKLEEDKTCRVSQIDELEKICKETLKN